MSFPYLTMAMCMFFSFLFLSVPLYIRMSLLLLHPLCWWIFDLSIGIPRRMARTYVYVCVYVYVYVYVCIVLLC